MSPRPRKRSRRAAAEPEDLLSQLEEALNRASDPSYKKWHEKYMRDATPARGVRMEGIRSAVRVWYDAKNVGALPRAQQLQLALSLFRGVYTEDKLAGVLILAEFLSPSVMLEDLAAIGTLFDDGLVADWNVCDWLAVKVLMKFVASWETSSNSSIRAESLEVLDRWISGSNVWQARAALLAQMELVGDADERQRLSGLCKILLVREERFAKTAVGWLLAECDKCDRQFVEGFIAENISDFNVETLRKATKRFPSTRQKALVADLRDKQRLASSE